MVPFTNIFFHNQKIISKFRKTREKREKKGFKTAFIVAFKGNKQIKLSEALRN